MSGCNIYFRENDAIVVSQGISPEVVGLTIKPFFKVSLPVEAEVLGRLVLIALDSQREGVPLSAAEGDDLLRFAHARSWKALETGSFLVGIGLREGVVTVIPHKQAGKSGGFSGLEDLIGHCQPVAEEIGHLALEKAKECWRI